MWSAAKKTGASAVSKMLSSDSSRFSPFATTNDALLIASTSLAEGSHAWGSTPFGINTVTSAASPTRSPTMAPSTECVATSDRRSAGTEMGVGSVEGAGDGGVGETVVVVDDDEPQAVMARAEARTTKRERRMR